MFRGATAIAAMIALDRAIGSDEDPPTEVPTFPIKC
jgi:hypothetical protein